jgi:hypothetical protein
MQISRFSGQKYGFSHYCEAYQTEPDVAALPLLTPLLALRQATPDEGIAASPIDKG